MTTHRLTIQMSMGDSFDLLVDSETMDTTKGQVYRDEKTMVLITDIEGRWFAINLTEVAWMEIDTEGNNIDWDALQERIREQAEKEEGKDEPTKD